MAWELLPVNYTDAVWSGLKKYVQVDNPDGTVSFQDVTQYSQKETSFFGAYEANRMNEALNTLMSMVESGTDLYTAFQNYFDLQKTLFETEADSKQDGLESYVEDLEAQGDSLIASIQTDYRTEMNQFESQQEQLFNVWFEAIRGQLSSDVAGRLQLEINDLDSRLTLAEHMVIANDISAPIATDDEQVVTLLVDDDGKSILTYWKHEEVE